MKSPCPSLASHIVPVLSRRMLGIRMLARLMDSPSTLVQRWKVPRAGSRVKGPLSLPIQSSPKGSSWMECTKEGAEVSGRFGSWGCGNLSGSKGTRDHARGIARHLRQRGCCVSGSASFVVEGRNGPLKPGELERAREWAALPAAKVTETLAGDARR